MHSRALVTGANGRVGRVLRQRLGDLHVSFTARNELNVTDAVALRAVFAGHEQIVHLATPIKGNAGTLDVFQHSVDMVRLVLGAARDAGVRRVIIPSSIRALADDQLRGTEKVTLADSRPATGEYGRTRIVVEAMCRDTAAAGLDAICVRLGWVRHPDIPSTDVSMRPHWLSHEDCASMFRACLEAPIEPGRFSLFYAVSDLPERILDISNPLGWAPRSREVGFRRGFIAALHRVNTGIRGRLRIRTRWKALGGGRDA